VGRRGGGGRSVEHLDGHIEGFAINGYAKLFHE